jgi:hypothetical protein
MNDRLAEANSQTKLTAPAAALAGRRKMTALRILTDACLVFGGLVALTWTIQIVQNQGGFAYDTHAYWLAGRNILDGTTLYKPASVSDLGAYKYPPVYAQLFVPLALLPDLLVAWIWRIGGLLCLRYIVGSWKAAVVACAFLPVMVELDLGNVTLQIAALLLFALRDRRGAYLLPWAVALKFGPALIVPYLWFHMPDSRRPLLAGTAVFAVACLASFVVAPGEWVGYVSTFGWENSSIMSAPQVIAIVPSWGGLDFAIRFGIAGVVALLAAYWRRGWLAYAAASITCPILAWTRFAPLVGLWRFRPAGWPGTEQSSRSGTPATRHPVDSRGSAAAP